MWHHGNISLASSFHRTFVYLIVLLFKKLFIFKKRYLFSLANIFVLPLLVMYIFVLDYRDNSTDKH